MHCRILLFQLLTVLQCYFVFKNLRASSITLFATWKQPFICIPYHRSILLQLFKKYIFFLFFILLY